MDSIYYFRSAVYSRRVNTTTNKTYTFLVCLPSGAAEFADIVAQSSAEAVRLLVAKYGRVRANIINIY